jgi:hypothetical protein
MGITFQKRQKEMKRQEKQREKAARRAQRKLDKIANNGVTPEDETQPNDQPAAEPHGADSQ